MNAETGIYKLPVAACTRLDTGGFSYLLVHGHAGERFTQDTIVNSPGAQADAVGRFGRAERRRAVQGGEEVAAGRETCLNSLHQPASFRIGITVFLEYDSVVIVKRLYKVNVMPQVADKTLKGLDCLTQHTQAAANLAGRETILHGLYLGLDIALEDAEACGGAVGHAIYGEARRFRVIENVEQDMDLAAERVGDVPVQHRIRETFFVVKGHLSA